MLVGSINPSIHYSHPNDQFYITVFTMRHRLLRAGTSMRQCSPDEVLSMLSAGANFSHFVHMLHDTNVNIGVCSMWAAEK
eukprot:Em0020g754a